MVKYRSDSAIVMLYAHWMSWLYLVTRCVCVRKGRKACGLSVLRSNNGSIWTWCIIETRLFNCCISVSIPPILPLNPNPSSSKSVRGRTRPPSCCVMNNIRGPTWLISKNRWYLTFLTIVLEKIYIFKIFIHKHCWPLDKVTCVVCSTLSPGKHWIDLSRYHCHKTILIHIKYM